MLRGEVWWAKTPLSGGSRKRRPFLILSADAFNINERYPKVMAIHLTSLRRVGGPYPWEVELHRGEGGMPMGSIAKCGEIFTLLKEQFDSRVGMLTAARMHDIERALSVALSLRLSTEPLHR